MSESSQYFVCNNTGRHIEFQNPPTQKHNSGIWKSVYLEHRFFFNSLYCIKYRKKIYKKKTIQNLSEEMVRVNYNIVFELFVRHSSGSVERLRYRKTPVYCVSCIWAIHISADIWEFGPHPSSWWHSANSLVRTLPSPADSQLTFRWDPHFFLLKVSQRIFHKIYFTLKAYLM